MKMDLTSNEPSQDVKFQTSSQHTGIFLVDSNNNVQLFSILILFLTSFFVHLILSTHSPSILSTKVEKYDIEKTKSNITVQSNFQLTDLTLYHRFFAINMSLIRDTVTDDVTKGISIQTSISHSSNSEPSIFNSSYYLIHFKRLESISSSVPYFSFNFDSDPKAKTLSAQSLMSTDFSTITGFQFNWVTFNPVALKYSQVSRFILSILLIYMLFIYFIFMNTSKDSLTQISLVFLGFSAILACNPIEFFLNPSTSIILLQRAFQSLFVAIFRFFSISQLILIKSDETHLNPCVFVLLLIFFGIYGIVDGMASFEEEHFISALQIQYYPQTTLKKTLYCFDIGYTILSLVFVSISLTSEKQISKRNVFMSVITVITTMTTIFVNVFIPINGLFVNSIFPSIFFQSIHFTIVSFLLYMLRLQDGTEYTQVDDDKLINSLSLADVDENAGVLVSSDEN